MPFVVNTFDNAVETANPNAYPVYRLANSHDGAPHNGLPPANDYANPTQGDTNISTGDADTDATGLVLDYTYTTPIAAITSVRFWNNGGAVLNDQDGAASIDIEIFNSLNVSIFGPTTLLAGDGAAPFILDVGLLQDVARVQVTNITATPGGNPGGGPYNGGIWFGELETVTPDADCAGATDITTNSATMNATVEAVSDGNFYQWSWGTFPDPELFDRKSPLIPTDGSNPNFPGPDNISYPTGGALQPNTTYYYQVCIYDGDAFAGPGPQDGGVSGAETYNSSPICSEVCSFTTLDAASWCGGFFNPSACIPVDIDGDTDTDYFNCNQF